MERDPLRIWQPKANFDWIRHFGEWHDCTKCVIGQFACQHVFARGSFPCNVLFIGEAPGPKEDLAGYPFVGPSGRLLDKWITHAEVYREETVGDGIFSYGITNMVCCQPVNEKGGKFRAPGIQELQNCQPRLIDFIDNIAKPQIIILIGKPASRSFPRKYAALPTLHIKHPSWFLRQHLEGSEIEHVQMELMAKFIVRELGNAANTYRKTS